MKFIFYILLLIFTSTLTFAQSSVGFDEMKAIYERTLTHYNKSHYYIEMKYESYKGHLSMNPEDVVQGYVIKNKNAFASYLHGYYSVQNEAHKFIIDSTDNTIAISYPDKITTQYFSMEEFEASRYNIETITEQNINRKKQITLKYKRGYSFDKVVYLFSHDGLFEEIVIYYASYIYYKDENDQEQKEKAKVKITFNYSDKKVIIPIFIEDMVSISSKEYKLKPAFKDYELIDMRYQN